MSGYAAVQHGLETSGRVCPGLYGRALEWAYLNPLPEIVREGSGLDGRSTAQRYS